MTNEFDPLHYAQSLEAAGVPKGQATVHAQALREVVVLMAPAHQLAKVEARLRQNIAEAEERLNLRVDTMRSELLAKIELLRVSIDSRIEGLRVEFSAKMEAVRHEVETSRVSLQGEIGQLKVELRMLKWVLTIQLGATITILFKLFSPL